MTHYEKQIARNLKFADRIQTLVQTPTLLIFVVDGRTTYAHEYDENGACVSAQWWMARE